MSDVNHIESTLREFFRQTLNFDCLDSDQDLFESGIVNSLFAVQLMTFVERTYGIEITVDDLNIENFKSLAATASFVLKKSTASVA